MSSILDALERAEQERNALGVVPLREPLSRHRRLWQQPRVWLFGAGLLLLNLLVWWLMLEPGVPHQVVQAPQQGATQARPATPSDEVPVLAETQSPPKASPPASMQEAPVKPKTAPVTSAEKTTTHLPREAVARSEPVPIAPVPAAPSTQPETESTTPPPVTAEVAAGDLAAPKQDAADKTVRVPATSSDKTTATEPLLQEAQARSAPAPITPVPAVPSAQPETKSTAPPPVTAEVAARKITAPKQDAADKTDTIPTPPPGKTTATVPLLQEAVTKSAPVPAAPPAQPGDRRPTTSPPAAEVAAKDTATRLESSEPSQPTTKLAAVSKQTAAETAKVSAPAEPEAPASEPELAKVAPAVAAEAVIEQAERIPQIWELPEAVQKKFKNLEINIHVYNEVPEARFVIIDMRRYREGDPLDRPGLKLESITREGVVIHYGKGRVRM